MGVDRDRSRIWTYALRPRLQGKLAPEQALRGGIGINPRLVKPPIYALAALAILAGLPYMLAWQPHFFGRPVIAGVSLAGFSRSKAEPLLREQALALASAPMRLVYGREDWLASPTSLGVKIDYRRPLDEAWSVGRRGGPLRRWREIIAPPILRRDLSAEPRPDRVRAALHRLQPAVEREPVNAAFDLETGALLPERPGRRLDLARSLPALARAAVRPENRLARLAMLRVAPRTTRKDLLATRVRYLIARYSTFFDPDVHVRAANINRGALKINGLLIPPGGVFSFNAATGPRDKAHGYGEALEIVNDRLVPGVGGGICQVSSTLYNAAILAGLEVVRRYPHSLPLGYVPLGRDATVYFDRLDLVFRNTTPGNLLILAQTKGDRVIVALMAEERPAYAVEIDVSILEEIPFIQEVQVDPALPPGLHRVERPGQKGYKTKTVRRIWQGGRVIREEVLSVDTYKPQPELVRTGPPKPTPAPMPPDERSDIPPPP